MAYKALKSFIGLVNMKKGEIKEIDDKAIAESLLSLGYIEEIKSGNAGEVKTKKPAKTKKAEEA